MKITINGKSKKIGVKTLGELMKFLKFNPEKVIVSVNGKPVGKKKFPETILSEDDKVDVFSFVGGG